MLVVSESRWLADLTAPPRAEDTEGWRPGLAGGPMEFLVPVDGRALADAVAAAPPRALAAFAGVPVRDVEALDVAVPKPSCFVGDFVGD